jgi:3-phenylpropionate/trans-cinnamate dioxygenase ferredoxin reductase subunit
MRDEIALRLPSRYEDLGIELVLGARVEGVRAGVAYADAGTWGFDRLVLATGARPRHLPGPRPSNVRHLRTLDDALSLRERLQPGRRLVVVGSGFVGAEVATTAARIGVDVTVVEAAKSPLGGVLGVEVGSLLAAAYRRLGIELRLGASVERVEPRFVLLDDGTCLAHDVVLVAIGVDPSLDFPADDAIVAGDATGGGHWTTAADQGIAAARRLLGLPIEAPRPPFVWSDQLGLRLQLVGRTRMAAGVELDGDEASFVARYIDAQGSMVGAVAANRPADTAALRRELAALASAA